MAAGSSMPEVFSSFMALANSSTDNSLGMVRAQRQAVTLWWHQCASV